MRQIIEEIRENGVEEDHIIYINFEDYKYRKICNPDTLYEYAEEHCLSRLWPSIFRNFVN